MEKQNGKARTFNSFAKGLKIMDTILMSPDGLKLKDLAKKIGVSSATIVPYVNTLLECGYCVRDEGNMKYFVAPQKREDFANSTNYNLAEFKKILELPVKKLHAKYNENVLIAIKRLDRVVFISRIVSTRRVRIEIEQKPDYPLHATAAGRAILAFFPDEYIEDYLDKSTYDMYTTNTLASKKSVLDEIKLTRERGFSFNNCEFEDEIRASAIPIFCRGKVVASLVLQFPSFRYTIDECLKITQDALPLAKKASEELDSSPIFF